MTIKPRSNARALALQALCQYDVLGKSFANQVSEFLRDSENLADLAIEGLSDDLFAFAAALANGAWENHAAYDAILQEAAPDWSVRRMPPVDRNILRLGLHEWHTNADTPFSVIVNEMIELARRFGGQDSPKFVNGVLDGIRRRREQPAEPTAGA